MLQKSAIGIGALLVLIGVAGFFSTTDSTTTQQFLGIFAVDVSHNLFFIASGLAAFAAATNETYAKRYFQIFGIIYMFVAVIGLMQENTVLGVFDVSMADNILHVGFSILLLGIGFAPKSESDDGS